MRLPMNWHSITRIKELETDVIGIKQANQYPKEQQKYTKIHSTHTTETRVAEGEGERDR